MNESVRVICGGLATRRIVTVGRFAALQYGCLLFTAFRPGAGDLRRLLARWSLLVVVALSLPMSFGQSTITITKGYADKTDIAVVPFLWDGNGAAPSAFSDIVVDDLERTGQFAALSESRMRSWPTRRASIVFSEWRLLEQDFLVIGRIEPVDGSTVRVAFELYDPYRENRVVGQTVTGNLSDWRRLAHRVSDAIYEEITGVRGVFSTRIAYVAVDRENGRREHNLHIADADGANSEVWYRSERPLMSPAWGPDANRLAFVSFEPDGSSVIRLLDRETRRIRTVAAQQGSINSAPAFSPDGRRLAFTSSRGGNADIYLLDLTSGSLRQVTSHWAIETEPAWLDEDTLVFTSDRSGRPQLYRLRLGENNARRLTFEGQYNARPRVSDDGERLTMVHSAGAGYNIATLNLNTDQFQVLTSNNNDEAPSIAPNGTMVIYARSQNGRSELAWVSIDGMVENIMPSQFGNVRDPAWSPYTY